MLIFFMRPFQISYLYLAMCTLASTSVLANTETTTQSQNEPAVLDQLTVDSTEEPDSYVATHAASVLKSDAPLFETAQSVSVVTREQLDQKQATTLNEALQGVSGVTAGFYGRRGFDDVIIRGQTSTDNMFIDGLRLSKDLLNAIDLSGMQEIQVLKGPASVNFGLIQPGGLINATTKRPQAETFYRAGLSYGSYDFKQATFDLNYAPQHSEKGAFRLTGRVANQDDATDYVYFKNLYLAPSYTFDLGERSDLSVAASYQKREYLRSQGVPTVGTLIKNSASTFENSRFINDLGNIYNYEVYRLGYNFEHRFDNDWKFKQNFAYFNSDMTGSLLAFRGFAANSNNTIITRRVSNQDRNIQSYSMDNSLQKNLQWGATVHDVMLGVDGMTDELDAIGSQSSNSGNNLNLNQPVYGQARQTITSRTHSITRTQYLGLYLKDRISWDDRLIMNLAGRYDWADSKVNNKLSPSASSSSSDTAFTGNASLMYKWNNILAPYVSYATSFMPQAGATYDGQAYDPEEGKQIEVGLKLQSPDQRIQASLAWFDLKKQNVATDDPEHDGYSVLVGEQTTRGIETEFAANLSPQWQLSANYSYTPEAKITKTTVEADLGAAINQIPKHAWAINTQYYFAPDRQGWYLGGGLRYVGNREVAVSGLAVDHVNLPDYTVYDVNIGYVAKRWSSTLVFKNLFDQVYYTGIVSPTLSGGVVALGDRRQINFSVNFNY
jgi:iron complex outermembrane receptor protein